MSTNQTPTQANQTPDQRFLVHDKTSGRDYYGGDQAWFLRNTRAHSGCSHVAGVNMLLSMTGKFPISKEAYLRYMNEMYHCMGAFEVPIVRRFYDRASRDAKFFKRIPPSFGQNSTGYMLGVKRFARRHSMRLRAMFRPTFLCSYSRGLRFIRKGLAECGAVTLLTGRNRHPLTVYSRIRTLLHADPYDLKDGMRNHFVTITGIDDSSSKVKLIVSTWGRIATIDYDALVKSWHSLKAYSSAMYYFKLVK